MMDRGRRAIAGAIAAAVVVTTASACSGTAASSAHAAGATAKVKPKPTPTPTPTPTLTPGPHPLASLTSYQIIGLAFANTEAALNVQITGTITRIGETTRLSSLTLVNASSGCVGDVFQFGIGTFQLLDDGTTAWVLPGPDYWSNAATAYAAELPRLEGRYVRVTPGAGGLGMLTSLCSLTALAGSGPSPIRETGLGPATPTTVGGLPAVKITDTADGGYAVISDSVKPKLLSFFVPGDNGSNFTLSYSGIPVTVSGPPGNEVVDSTQYDL